MRHRNSSSGCVRWDTSNNTVCGIPLQPGRSQRNTADDMKQSRKSFYAVCALLSLYLGSLALQKINLVPADLGRHLKNGELLLSPGAASWQAVLHTNLFSYTNPDFPFVNHHWMSGILFYVLYLGIGFPGLSLVSFLALVAAMCVGLGAIRKEVRLPDVLVTGLLLIPLIAYRTEIRPEGLSYVFVLVFISLLYRHSQGKLDPKYLWFLPVIEVVWVNLHIFSIFGPCIIGTFLVESIIRADMGKTKRLCVLLGATAAATLVNPFGITLPLYPFRIFQNYGYTVAENLSIPFLEHARYIDPVFLWYKVALGFAVLSGANLVSRKRKAAPIALIIIACAFGGLGYFSVRYMPLFAMAAIPLGCIGYAHLIGSRSSLPGRASNALACVISVVLVAGGLVRFGGKLPNHPNWGIGLLPGNAASAEFVLANDLRGPIFNNFDIGGYLTFHFFPDEKVFVDNRPEAYPAAFFQDEYKPMQQNDGIWKTQLEKYRFNMIYFHRHDMTPWALQFLKARVGDPGWAPVYVDNYALIFLRRNTENASVINRFELPENIFVFPEGR